MYKKNKQPALTQFPGFSRVVDEPPSNAESKFSGFNPDNQVVKQCQVVKPCSCSYTHSKNALGVFSYKSGGGTCLNCDDCKAFKNQNYNKRRLPRNNTSSNKRRGDTSAAKRVAYEKSTLGDTIDLSGTTLTLTPPRLYAQY